MCFVWLFRNPSLVQVLFVGPARNSETGVVACDSEPQRVDLVSLGNPLSVSSGLPSAVRGLRQMFALIRATVHTYVQAILPGSFAHKKDVCTYQTHIRENITN